MEILEISIMSHLLNQSPELYESRSSDFERRISSPQWKKGIPCRVTINHSINSILKFPFTINTLIWCILESELRRSFLWRQLEIVELSAKCISLDDSSLDLLIFSFVSLQHSQQQELEMLNVYQLILQILTQKTASVSATPFDPPILDNNVH